MPEIQEEKLYNAKELAALLHCSVPTVATMRRAGLPYVNVAVRKYLYRETDVVAFIAKQTAKGRK